MRGIELYEKHKFILFPLRGKKPLAAKWQKTKLKQNSFPKAFKGNNGVVLQSKDLVLDFDLVAFKEHEKPN